ncbi:hypothetical protein Skr01_76070 [Sphaerisporangium krabiense]|uniref:Transposase IS4-like domain-containing protein n=1 Tax=Sphaerisporangium krabiense TaxID=763782 RepID=A0A7W8Z8L5_9ACTN|nr:hypothetical protein [Sphaerisporangium krabiense]MBB5629336.1 hypothetical protein [Sphaerisporangium krabiense]GII67522.1 hypothetical protein Skr01_76070 [Sphaerisporangium krabiense]
MSLVRVAGIRWAVEESFQAAKGQAGLDHYQVHGWTLWHRHITLAMLALALLAAIAAAQPPNSPDHIPLTLPKIRRLPAILVPARDHSIADILRWSDWRRHHQATARRCHYSADPNHDREMSLEY